MTTLRRVSAPITPSTNSAAATTRLCNVVMGTISNSLYCHHHRPDDGNQQQQRCDLEGKHVIAIQKQRDALRVLGFRQLRNCSWEKPLPFCIDHYEKHTQCQRRRDAHNPLLIELLFFL